MRILDMSGIKMIKKKEPIVDRIFVPAPLSQAQRYKKVSNELNQRGLTKLHDLVRQRIDELLNEVEVELAASFKYVA